MSKWADKEGQSGVQIKPIETIILDEDHYRTTGLALKYVHGLVDEQKIETICGGLLHTRKLLEIMEGNLKEAGFNLENNNIKKVNDASAVKRIGLEYFKNAREEIDRNSRGVFERWTMSADEKAKERYQSAYDFLAVTSKGLDRLEEIGLVSSRAKNERIEEREKPKKPELGK